MIRLRWLDLLRSFALLGMIVYHTAFDLQFFYNWTIDVTTGAWHIAQVAIAATFLGISGISAGFWTKSEHAWQRGWQRGWVIFSAAILVSLVTAIADPATWVRFGILHLIALSSFILPFLKRLHPLALGALGILCFALTPLDLMPHMTSVDYVPPIPWMGWVLIGFGTKTIVTTRQWQPSKPSRLFDAIALPGRYSLWIYLGHQPVILGFLWILHEVF